MTTTILRTPTGDRIGTYDPETHRVLIARRYVDAMRVDAPRRPAMVATKPVFPMPVWMASTPHARKASCTRAAVYTSSNPSSGWACKSRRNAVSSGCRAAMCAKARPLARKVGDFIGSL